MEKTKIYGKSANNLGTAADNIGFDQKRVYEAQQKNMKNLVAVTEVYHDEEKYESTKKYVENLADQTHTATHTSYGLFSGNCVAFANEMHQILGGGGTVGMLFTEAQYKKMNSEAGYQMKERFGMKDGFKVLTSLYNQEEKIAKKYNVPVENIKYIGVTFKEDGAFSAQNSYTVTPPSKQTGHESNCRPSSEEDGEIQGETKEEVKEQGEGEEIHQEKVNPEGMRGLHNDRSLINDALHYLDNEGLYVENIDNAQRLKIIRAEMISEGNIESAEMLGNLEVGHQQVFDFLNEL